MHVLGISGSVDLFGDEMLALPHFSWADSAAALLNNGNLVSALEEERLTRVKHCGYFPINAVNFCLSKGGIGIDDVDAVAYSHSEELLNFLFRDLDISPYRRRVSDVGSAITARLSVLKHSKAIREKLRFVPHHMAHAASAYLFSGFTEALIITLDGWGDDISGMVTRASKDDLVILDTYSVPDSLGLLYQNITYFLGFTTFSEYKVMGLAPYGDPKRFLSFFNEICLLEKGGKIRVIREKINGLFSITPPRKKNEPLTQVHYDIAASLQLRLEQALFHIVSHFAKLTGEKNLCLAGGVAHNCTATGKVLCSKLFEQVFVQPASHDAGCAIGAAAYVTLNERRFEHKQRLNHVYLGPDIGDTNDVEGKLRQWKDAIMFERISNPPARAAKLIADGNVIAWVQGRSEFGPRALGNRSILADPRPSSNKERINAMVKRRESFRPFAPSVLTELAHRFFEIPEQVDSLPFMVFIVKVREQYREILGAITHVDGTARVQTVSKEQNFRYWELLSHFNKLTGIPLVLNTSFNNNAEPIVDSVDDAVTTFLTTGLDYLIIDDFLVSKECLSLSQIGELHLRVPGHVTVQRTARAEKGSYSLTIVSEVINRLHLGEEQERISEDMYEVLLASNSKDSLCELILKAAQSGKAEKEKLFQEVLRLWQDRFIIITP